MATEKLQIIIDVDYDGKTVKVAGKDVKGLGEEAKKAETKMSNFQSGMKSMTEEVGKFSVGLVAAGAVIKATLDAASEGFDLGVAANQFDLLTASIDSSADAMLGRLRQATKGVVSDAELMASASEIISLGLADTEDGTIRLATVISKLGLDMQQVIMTFANDSKARLDSLGLSVTRVDELTQDFVATGSTVEQAFDLAVLAALEERVDLLGLSAGAAVDPVEQLATSWENLSNEIKVGLAEGLNPALSSLAALVGAARDADAPMSSLVKNFTPLGVLGADMADAAGDMNAQLTELAENADNVDDFVGVMMDLTGAGEEAAVMFFDTAKMVQSYNDNAAEAAASTEQWADKQAQLSNRIIESQEVIEMFDATMMSSNDMFEINSARAEVAAQAQERFTAAVEADDIANRALRNSLLSVNSTLQDQIGIFDESANAIEQSAQEIQNSFREIAFEAIVAQQGVTEASVAQGVALGLLTEEQAAARLEFTNTTLAMEELTSSQAFFTLSAEQQVVAVEALSTGMVTTAAAADELARGTKGVDQAANDAALRTALYKNTLDEAASSSNAAKDSAFGFASELASLPDHVVVQIRADADLNSARAASRAITDAARRGTGGAGGGGAGGAEQFLADGGSVLGPFNQPVPITAHGGEFVVNPQAAQANMGLLRQINNNTTQNFNLNVNSANTSAGVQRDFADMVAVS